MNNNPAVRRPAPLRILAILLIQVVIASDTFSQTVDPSQPNGYFKGTVIVEWLEHDGPDRSMILQEDFSYVDPNGKEWRVPAHTTIDGASIPKVLWSHIGPPFVGDYRRASVIHDYFCDTKSEPSKDVHRMYYHAALAGGVSPPAAKGMYLAIRLAGPSWRFVSGFDGSFRVIVVSPPKPELSLEEIEEAERWITSENPSLNKIDDYVDNLGD